MRKALFNAFLQNDFNGNGKVASNYGGLAVGYKTTKEVCLGIRTGGKVGSGAWDDPFDVSTKAKFDAKLAELKSLANTKVIIRLRDGVFDFTGTVAPVGNLMRGWQIFGEGMGVTIIKQRGSNSVFSYGGGEEQDRGDNWIEGITFDLAYFRTGPGGDNTDPNGRFTAVNIGGPNCKIRNVEVYGGGCDVAECFILLIQSGGGLGDMPDNALIEYCNVHTIGGANDGYSSFIGAINLSAATGAAPFGYAVGGKLLNNIAKGNYPTYVNQGLGLAGFDGGLITGSTITGMNHGIYDDTFANKNLTICNNPMIHAIDNGILFVVPSQPQENTRIFLNTIRSNSCIGMISDGSVIDTPFIGINRCIDLDGGVGNYSIFLQGVNEAVVIDNECDPSLAAVETDCTDTYYRGNIEPGGATHIPDTIKDIVGPLTLSPGPLSVMSPDNTLGTIIAKFLSENETLGVGINYEGIQMVGAAAVVALYLRPKGAASTYIGAGDKIGIDANGHIFFEANRILTDRKTGWSSAAGTAARGGYTTYGAPDISASPTEAEVQAIADHVELLSQHLKALIDDLHANTGHGLIGT